MRDCTDDEAKAFDCAARFSGKADNKSLFDNGGEVAREDGVLSDFHRFDAHHFAKSGQFADGNLADRFRCHVPKRDAGPASGKDQLGTLGDLFLNRTLYLAFFVRDEFLSCDFPSVTRGRLFQSRTAEVVVETFGSTVGNGDDAGLDLHFTWVHFFVFETRWISPMVICLSTALHMS